MKYEVVIGLEVHIQLKTASKLFCRCSTATGTVPNSQTCPTCLGYPGTLPLLNREAVRLAAMAGMLLDCEIATCSSFDRKSYFYPDAAKNYQTTQLFHPICGPGNVTIIVDDCERHIGITRIHLEEDVAKSTHHADYSTIDFNRAGTPLIELVTEPDLRTPAEALAFLLELRQRLVYAAIGECNLELGNMRCDANVSLRPAGTTAFGTKVEIKNLNTFKGVQAALNYEIERQGDLLDEGQAIEQETRRWDADLGITTAMRSKADAPDYRYMPDAELPPVVIDATALKTWRNSLPERPDLRRKRLICDYQIPPYDAAVVTAERPMADFFEAVAQRCGNGKAAANWIMTEVMALTAEANTTIGNSKLSPAALGDLIRLVTAGTINQPTAKSLLPELFANGGDPAAIVAERGLAQVGDSAAITTWVEQVFSENPGPVSDFIAGKKAAAGYLVGQVMKLSKGKADPKQVNSVVRQKLAEQNS